MTILYEPLCHGAEHAPFNAAILATALAAFPDDGVSFFSEASHGRAVSELLDRASVRAITWNTISIPPRAARQIKTRLRGEWRTVSTVLARAGTSSTARIVACSVTHTGLATLQGQLLARARHARVAVVHHSGLASTLGSRSTEALLRWTARGRIRHVVLGESIQQAVERRLPRTGVYSMRHPYLFPIAGASEWPGGEPLRFGFLGVATADKGFDRFCRLARHAAARSGAGAAQPRFELVGRLDAANRAGLAAMDAEGLVEIGSADAPMERSRYEQKVRGLTYAVLPYRPEHALASSGAMLDAFAYAKPCIALRTPLFEEYFAAMGDIGYLCDSEEQLTDVVSRLVTEPPDGRYAAQRRNIIAGREMFNPGRVAAELRQLFDDAPPMRATSRPRDGRRGGIMGGLVDFPAAAAARPNRRTSTDRREMSADRSL